MGLSSINEIGNINIHKENDIRNFEKETAIQRKIRKIRYILENLEEKDIPAKELLNSVKKEVNITDDSTIKELMWEEYRKKYFWKLEIELQNDLNKEKIIHILERSDEDIAEIKRLRAERKETKKARKERGKRKWVQTTIKFPKDKE